MPLPGSKILVWVVPPTAFVRLEGRATVERARDFKVLVARLDAGMAEASAAKGP